MSLWCCRGPLSTVGRGQDGAALTMLDVLPEDPVLRVVLKCDKAALLGAADLREESGKNRRVSGPHSQRFPISLREVTLGV